MGLFAKLEKNVKAFVTPPSKKQFNQRFVKGTTNAVNNTITSPGFAFQSGAPLGSPLPAQYDPQFQRDNTKTNQLANMWGARGAKLAGFKGVDNGMKVKSAIPLIPVKRGGTVSTRPPAQRPKSGLQGVKLM